jgi:rhodanese-related sulfurtransferase
MTSEDSNSIIERARQRGQAKGLPYAGEVTPEEAYQLASQGAARIVDVRTRFEAEYVGRIEGTPLIEWKALGAAAPNPQFLDQLAALDLKGTKVLFLCRSGVRSHAAAKAAAEVGYHEAFNILEGFEGDLDDQKHRGSQAGWRHRGLPWIQG